MSFCRITGRSKGLPRPNYFPLLPPISPADAKRFCRITGKSYGLPSHHYTPVVLVKSGYSSRKCQMTGKADSCRHKRHVVLAEYRYVFPDIDSSSQSQKLLTEVLAAKNEVTTARDCFVYVVEERCCSLVLPANLEAAVRDGDVRDLMLAKDSDTVLLHLRQGQNITLDVKDVVMEDVDLWEGKGPTEDAQKQWEQDDAVAKKRKKKRSQGLKFVKNVFEDKERLADLDESVEVERKQEKAKIADFKLSHEMSGKLLEIGGEEDKKRLKPERMSWNNFVLDFPCAGTRLYVAHGYWRDLVKPLVEAWDWEAFEKEASLLPMAPTVTTLPPPIMVALDIVDLRLSLPGLHQQPAGISEKILGFEPVPAIVPFNPLITQPDDIIQEAIKCLSKELLGKTANVSEILSNAGTPHSLPTREEIPEIMENLEKGREIQIFGEVNGSTHGLIVDTKVAQRFVPGQSVETPHGMAFVPGQTVQTPSGTIFMPGITVSMQDGPVLIPGQKMFENDSMDNKTPVFIAGQNLTTRQGEEFVAGQIIQTLQGPKFVAGQTVYTKKGPKFVAGQTIVKEDGYVFVPGQTIVMEEGPEFVPGQTIATHQGNVVFIPGQTVKKNEDWEFVPGQALKSSGTEAMFVAGQTLVTSEGAKFIAGQTVFDENMQVEHFVPGITIFDENKISRFVPGKVVETAKGLQFLEGQILNLGTGKMFVPGKTRLVENSSTVLQFIPAKSPSTVVIEDITLDIRTIDPLNMKIVPSVHKEKHIFGHMVQTVHGVEFFPGPIAGLPAGKVVPGELIHSDGGEVHFVPGIINEGGNFIPGQIVMTERNEQFVPGQVVNTKDGTKFVPGLVVETQSGPKFVPGQTINSLEGPQFVPGQIVETKAGPTFIPGQVISTENEGSRFVPGQVVDTVEGPRFVPGRVVVTSDKVTFVPGLIVNTDSGLHFVASDLQGSPSGELEFSVQGFEVSPEELKLLQPLTVVAPCFAKRGQMAIDSEMLRQLAEAGMSVGKQVPADIPVVAVNTTVTESAMEIAQNITGKLGLKENSALKMGEVVDTVAHITGEMLEYIEQKKYKSFGTVRGSSEEMESSVRGLAQAVIKAVLLIARELRINSREKCMPVIGTVLEDILKDVINLQQPHEAHVVVSLVDSLHIFFVKPGNMNVMCDRLIFENVSKVDIVREALGEDNKETAVEILMKLLQNGNSENGINMVKAFKVMSKSDPLMAKKVVNKVMKSMKNVQSEKGVVSAIQRAVVNAVREGNEQHVVEMMDQGDIKNILLQAVGLAQALGMIDMASTLSEVLSDPKSLQVVYKDPLSLSILHRLAVMRKLAEGRPRHMSALENLQCDPRSAILDPHVNQLFQESTSLIGLPKVDKYLPLESSDDIPSILFDNAKAMEEFVRSKRHYGPLLILKRGLQAVVPREAARAVLTGQIAYTVLDEIGIRRFEPLHVLSALRLPRPASQWFSMYSCPMEEDSLLFSTTTATGTLTPVSDSSEDLCHDKTTTCDIRPHSPSTCVLSNSLPADSKNRSSNWASETTPSSMRTVGSRRASDTMLRISASEVM